MKGKRYTSDRTDASYRCRAIVNDGFQCRAKSVGFVSFYAVCMRHRNTLIKQLKPLSFVEL